MYIYVYTYVYICIYMYILVRVCICKKVAHCNIYLIIHPSIRPSIHPSLHIIYPLINLPCLKCTRKPRDVFPRPKAPQKMICKIEVGQTLQSRAIRFTEYWWVPFFREIFKLLMKVDDTGSATL